MRKQQAQAHELDIRETKELIEVHSPCDGEKLDVFYKAGWDSIYTHGKEGFESFEDVGSRILKFISTLSAAHSGFEVACVTHGDCVFAARLLAEGLSCDLPTRMARDDLYPHTASVTTLFVDRLGNISRHNTWRPIS